MIVLSQHAMNCLNCRVPLSAHAQRDNIPHNLTLTLVNQACLFDDVEHFFKGQHAYSLDYVMNNAKDLFAKK